MRPLADREETLFQIPLKTELAVTKSSKADDGGGGKSVSASAGKMPFGLQAISFGDTSSTGLQSFLEGGCFLFVGLRPQGGKVEGAPGSRVQGIVEPT